MKSVYIIAPSISLSEAEYLVVQAHQCRDALGMPLPIGFLHAESASAMARLDAKQRRAAVLPSRRRDLLIDATGVLPPALGGDLETVSYWDVSASWLAGREAGLLGLTAHGMSDLLHLGADYICGKREHATGDNSLALPSCMTTGGCFHKPEGQPLRAFQIRASHVFVSSCGSLQFDATDFGPEFDIWRSVLTGEALSYCGTLRWKAGTGVEALLYAKLLRSGHSLGEACAVVNDCLFSLGTEAEPVYALVGDPAYRPHPSVDAVAREAQEVSLGRCDVVLADGYARLQLRGRQAVLAAQEGALAVHGHEKARSLFGAYAVTGSDVTVHCLSVDGFSGPVTVEINDLGEDRSYTRDTAKSIQECLDPGLGMGGLYPESARTALRRDLESHMSTIARLDRERCWRPLAARNFLSTVRQLKERVDDFDATASVRLADRLRSSTYRFVEQYAAGFILVPAEPGPMCPYCNSSTHVRRVRHAVRPEITRAQTICGRCGGIADSPDSRVRCTIDTVSIGRVGHTVRFRARIENHGAAPMDGYCVYGLRKTSDLNIDHGENIQRFSVLPTGCHSLNFSFWAAQDVPAHQFDLQVVVITQARIYLARRNFWFINA